MVQKEKELLFQDMCSRLPYGVMLNIEDIAERYNDKLFSISLNHGNELYINGLCIDNNGYDSHAVIKSYLFPLSSMTEEQKQEYQYITERWMYDSSYSISDSMDWLHKNNFDYRGLIPMGLAIDASNLNIY